MAEGKNKIVVYSDWKDSFEELTDEEAGKLIKHFFRYVNDENPVLEDRILKVSWIPIEKTLKRDLKKWEEYVDKQKSNGKKGGRPRKTQKTQAFSEIPKKGDSDSVRDSVSDKDNEIINDVDVSDIDVVFEELKNEIKGGGADSYIELILMDTKIKKESLNELLPRFRLQLKSENKVHKNLKEMKKHFRNWLFRLDIVGKLNQYKRPEHRVVR